MAIRKILVPIDFSDTSSYALDYAIELAKTLPAELHLLHCYQINPGSIAPYGIVIPESFERDVRAAATEKLAEWCNRAGDAGVEVHEHLTPRFPSEAIPAHASEIGADLIVMGTRGLSGLKHVLLGSVAERTVRVAPCPVLTVKQPEDG